jgi:hypothetical protein
MKKPIIIMNKYTKQLKSDFVKSDIRTEITYSCKDLVYIIKIIKKK